MPSKSKEKRAGARFSFVKILKCYRLFMIFPDEEGKIGKYRTYREVFMKDDLLTARQRLMLGARMGIRFLILVAVVLAVSRFGPGVARLTMPFLLGWGMAVLLDTPVRWAEKRFGVPRKMASLVIVLLLLGLVGGGLSLGVYYAGRELVDLARNWDVLFDAVQNVLDSLELMFARLFAVVPPELTSAVDMAINEVLLWMEETIPEALKGLGERAAGKFMGVPSFVVSSVMFLMGTYFITADYPDICRRAEKSMGVGLSRFWSQIRTTVLVAFGGYLRAQILLSCGVFCILLLGFLVTGQRYALLLAFGLAVLDFIPLLGAGTVMVPWAVIALFTKNYEQAIALMVIWGAVVVFRRVAEPKFVGNQTGLSPIVALISIYVGMRVAGVAGMVLGPIVTLVVLNLLGLGLLNGTKADLRLAVEDVAAILRGSGGQA
jgi:sporulation integral membrane protein YtvI